jgi:hypothetical protein
MFGWQKKIKAKQIGTDLQNPSCEGTNEMPIVVEPLLSGRYTLLGSVYFSINSLWDFFGTRSCYVAQAWP